MKNKSVKNTALVLTGGGARASYQVGVLKALGELLPGQEGPFTIFSGTSAGSINAGYLASQAQDWSDSTESLHSLWKSLQLNQIYVTDGLSVTTIAASWVKRTLFGFFIKKHDEFNYMLDTAPLQNFLKEHLDFKQLNSNLEKGVLAGVSFTAFEYALSQTVSFFQAGKKIDGWKKRGRLGISTQLSHNHILASSAIPVFFPPIFVSDRFYGDGSLREIAPLSPAVHLGADRIVAVSIRHEDVIPSQPISEPTKSPSLAAISGELMHALFLDALDSDTERLERFNRQSLKYPESGVKNIPILILTPSKNLSEIIPDLLGFFPATLRFLFSGLGVSSDQGNELLSYLAFLPQCIHPLMELGYQDTYARKDEILKFMNDGMDSTTGRIQ